MPEDQPLPEGIPLEQLPKEVVDSFMQRMVASVDEVFE